MGLYEVATPDLMRVILEERRPGLTATALMRPPHVLLDGALADQDAELQKLTPDALRAPEAILRSHFSDQLDRIGGQSPLPRSAPRPSPPEEPEAFPVPPQHGLRLNDCQCAAPRGKQHSRSQNSEPI